MGQRWMIVALVVLLSASWFSGCRGSTTNATQARGSKTTLPKSWNDVMALYQDVKYNHFINRSIEEHGHEVTLDWSSLPALWGSVHEKYQPLYIFYGVYAFMNILYWFLGILFIAVEQLDLFSTYKIHKGIKNEWSSYAKCFGNLFWNAAFIVVPMLTPGWFVFRMLGMSYSVDEFPSLFTVLWQLAIFLVGEDFFQYFFHRLLHTPYFYKTMHKVHHEFMSPFALTASYAHPVDFFFLAIATFAPALIMRPHLFTFYCWVVVRQLDAVAEHSGYDIPNPLHVLPFYGGITFHDFHHTAFTTNYASRFTILDKLFGTYKEPPLVFGEQGVKKKSLQTTNNKAKNDTTEEQAAKKKLSQTPNNYNNAPNKKQPTKAKQH